MKRYRIAFVLLVGFATCTNAQAQQRSPNPSNPQGQQQLDPAFPLVEQATPLRRSQLGDAIASYQDNLTRTALPFIAQNPGGAWWTNANVVARLGITDEQKGKLERAFENHRPRLESSKQRLEKEEAQLAKLLDTDTVDRNAVLAQIDRVVQARGDMERANSAMTLEMREVLTRAQWNQVPQPSVGTTDTTRFTGTVTTAPPGTQPVPPAGGRGGGAGQRSGGRGGAPPVSGQRQQ